MSGAHGRLDSYRAAEPEPKPVKKKYISKGRTGKGPNYTKLSAACQQGRHSGCTAKKCECKCGHGIVG